MQILVRKRCRRILLWIASAAILGIATNVAIALVLAWRSPRPPKTQAFGFNLGTSGPTTQYSLQWCEQFGRDSFTVTYIGPPSNPAISLPEIKRRFNEVFHTDPGATDPSDISSYKFWSDRFFNPNNTWPLAADATNSTRRAFSSGFPFRTLHGQQSLNLNTGTVNSSRGVLRDDPFDPTRAICILPVPLGFAAGGLLYALPWFVLLLLPSLRQGCRLRRGHCPLCNYDLRANLPSGCPECGWNRAATAKT